MLQALPRRRLHFNLQNVLNGNDRPAGENDPPLQRNVMSFKPQPRVAPSFFRCLQLVYRFSIDNRKPARYNKFTIYWRTRIFKIESHT